MEAELDVQLYDNARSYSVNCEWTIQAVEDPDLVEVSTGGLLQKLPQSVKGDLVVEIIKLRAKAKIAKMQPFQHPLGKEDASGALKGEREVSRGSEKVWSRLYTGIDLPGNHIQGPAILEGRDSTYIVPRNWTFAMDQYQNGVLTRR